MLVIGLVLGCITATSLPAESARAAAIGTFTIGADPVALNQSSDPGMGALAPSANAPENGMFGPQVDWPLLPLHAALVRNGHLITFGTTLGTAVQGGLQYDDWDTNGGFSTAAHTDTDSMEGYNSFCNSLVELADGRLLMVGGNSTTSSMIYDPATGRQEMGDALARQRWYASTLRLTDGRILVVGGGDPYNTSAFQSPDGASGVAVTPEISDGRGPWTSLTGATSQYAFGTEDNRWWYPRAFNGPHGDVVGLSGNHLWSLSTSGDGSAQATGSLPFDPRVSGSQVMYSPGHVLVAGGGQINNEDPAAATADAAVVDFNGTAPSPRFTSPMHDARNWLNLTVLPTGEVLANGGTRVGVAAGDANSVKQAEIWNPDSGQWRTAAVAQRTRTYHSTSLLLPSGAVFTGGGGSPGPEDNLNAELYYPAYLFTRGGDGTARWASRPAISTISGSATYGGTVSLGIADGRVIAAASLISLPSVTHSQNTDQRRIPLDITQQGATVAARLPDSTNTMPPGDYELTVVDRNGVPSTSQIVTVRQGSPGSVTVAAGEKAQPAAPGGSQAAAPGSAAAPGEPQGQAPVGTAAPAAPGTPDSPGTPTGAGDPEASAAPGSSKPVSDPVVALTVGRSVGLQPVARTGVRLAHAAANTAFVRVDAGSNKHAKDRSSWVVRAGLSAGKGLSFESVDEPGAFLVASMEGSGAVRLVKPGRSRALAARATFVAVHDASGTSFQLATRRSLVLAQKGSGLVLRPAGARSRKVGSFLVHAGYSPAPPARLAAGRSITLEAVGRPGYAVHSAGSSVLLDKVSGGASDDVRSSWTVSSLGHHRFVFESAAHPGRYLAAPARGTGALGLTGRGSAGFSARVTFTARFLGEGGVALQVTARPHRYLETVRRRLVIGVQRHRPSSPATTFAVHTGARPAFTQ